MQQANDIHFERCSYTDVTSLHDIAIRTYNEHYTHLWDDQGASYLNTFYSKSLFDSSLLDPAFNYYLIYYSNELAGFFKLRIKAIEPYLAWDCLELNKIYILKKFTGLSIGRKTLAFITTLALAMNRNVLWLNVMEKSRAKNFYEQNGFIMVKQTRLDYPQMKADLNFLLTYKKQLT